MPNTAINRDKVHALAEACSDQGDAFQSVATRLIKNQRRLSRFFEQNVGEMGPLASQVGLYMLSVSLRIFDQIGGRLSKVNSDDIASATAKVQAAAADLFDERVAVRAHLLHIAPRQACEQLLYLERCRVEPVRHRLCAGLSTGRF